MREDIFVNNTRYSKYIFIKKINYLKDELETACIELDVLSTFPLPFCCQSSVDE